MTNGEATGEQETALDFTLQAFYGWWRSWEERLAQVIYQDIFLLIYHVALEFQVRKAYSVKDS